MRRGGAGGERAPRPREPSSRAAVRTARRTAPRPTGGRSRGAESWPCSPRTTSSLPGADATKDVYVRDLKTDKTKLVSKSTSGDPCNENAGDDPAIAGRGRFVAFTTSADNLPGGDGGIYVRDLKRGKTTLASRRTSGDPSASNTAGRPELSADGRLVSFELDDDDFPGEDGTLDAYVRDRKTGRTSLMTRATDGTPWTPTTPSTPRSRARAASSCSRRVRTCYPATTGPGMCSSATASAAQRPWSPGRRPADPVGGGHERGLRSPSMAAGPVSRSSDPPDLGANQTHITVRNRRRGTTKPVSVTDDDQITISDTA